MAIAKSGSICVELLLDGNPITGIKPSFYHSYKKFQVTLTACAMLRIAKGGGTFSVRVTVVDGSNSYKILANQSLLLVSQVREK